MDKLTQATYFNSLSANTLRKESVERLDNFERDLWSEIELYLVETIHVALYLLIAVVIIKF